MKVVPITTAGDKSNEEVVFRLLEALDMANKGGTINCFVILADKDGNVSDCWANQNDAFAMVGALESLKKDFMDSVIETQQR